MTTPGHSVIFLAIAVGGYDISSDVTISDFKFQQPLPPCEQVKE